MSAGKQCRECGAAIPADSPAGLCGKCLLGLGLAEAQSTPEPGTVTAHPDATSTETVRVKGLAESEAEGATSYAAGTEGPGDVIARYKLLQEIGHGGFGVVYMAQQQEPVKRRVALKIIKLGMDTRQVVARFDAERQALALMDHPNIAKMLDAGATANGRPYFVMELVKGIRITDYCDQNKLSPRDRLELFIQICRAVQHAHQKGIIHRDIKPSNILVTLHDGVPVPKIIDFGIAKATQQELTEQTVFTQFGQFIGTPAYMSPEQAEMSGLDVDTRSDIYSLGVLLYELLTGKTPFDPNELMAAGLEEMRRMLREKEPARPSTKLSTLMGAELTLAASRRRVEAPKLVRLIRGDLDWIVMKCLEKDRTRRYETASRFADDIENFLHNEPVSARPPSRLYRLQRLVRRNRAAFAGSAVVVLSILAALVISTWMYAREKESRLRSEQVAVFLQSLLEGVEPSVARGRDTAILQELLDKAVERVSIELKEQPEVAAEICDTIGEVYRAIGQTAQAERMHRLALSLHGAPTRRTSAQVAKSLDDLGRVFHDQSKLVEAEALERRALELRLQLYGPDNLDVAVSRNDLALVLRDRGQWTEAENLHLKALQVQRHLAGDRSMTVATTLNNLAFLLRDAGRFADAETNFEQALAICRNRPGPDGPEVAVALDNLAFVKLDQGQYTNAETLEHQALLVLTNLYHGRDHLYFSDALNNLGRIYCAQGKLDDSENQHREALAMRRRTLGEENVRVANSLDDLALVLRRKKNLEEAEQRENEALAIRKALLGPEHLSISVSLNSLGLIQQDKKQLDQADKDLQSALTMQKTCLGTNEHPLFIATTLHNLGLLRREQGRLADAEAEIQRALAMREKWFEPRHPAILAARRDLAEIRALKASVDATPAQAAQVKSNQGVP
jgi:serine/threonine protein kinase/tetratricopeptide (TPR) repeat protein